MQQVPLIAAPSQTARVVLGDQNCQISVYQKSEGLLFDLSVAGTPIVSAVICRDMCPLICRQYLGFLGNLFFVDTQGASDPIYDGLGGRYALVYVTESENALIV